MQTAAPPRARRRPRPGARGVWAAVGWRVLGGAVVLWAAATAVFFAIRAVPGDPAEAILGGPGSQAGPEALEAARREYGLDLPLGRQYAIYLGRLLSGDLGTSYGLRRPVAEVIGEQVGGTVLLAALALLVAWLIALGWLLATSRVRGPWNAVGSGGDLVAASLPEFWLAAILIVVFSTTLRWLPATSTAGPAGLVLPVLALAIPLAGFLAQVMRDSMRDSLRAPYSLSARARGERGLGLRLRHSLRHAALPGVALSGWAFGYLVGGAVVIETIFARPGLGRTLLSAVTARDVPLVTGVVLASAAAYVLVTVVTDLVARLVDPAASGDGLDGRTAPR